MSYRERQVSILTSYAQVISTFKPSRWLLVAVAVYEEAIIRPLADSSPLLFPQGFNNNTAFSTVRINASLSLEPLCTLATR